MPDRSVDQLLNVISTGYVPCACGLSLRHIHHSHLCKKKVYKTSTKKHFIKNVKECRDVIIKNVYKQGWDGSVTHHIFDLIAPYVVITYLEG